MAWSDLTLSTLYSIQKYEAEINNLSGTYQKTVLNIPADTKIIVNTDLKNMDFLIIYEDGTQEISHYDGSTGWDVLIGGLAVVLIRGNIDVYPVTYNTNSNADVYNTSGTIYIDISASAVTRIDYNLTTWQNKIELAKKEIGDNLLTLIGKRGYTDDQLGTGETWLDYLTNTTALETVSDYKTLELIYQDLSYKGLNEVYERKITQYRDMYQKALNNALYQLIFAPEGTGLYMFNSIGHIQV